MPGEPTTPDLVELARQLFKTVNSGNLDAAMGFYAPGAVWDAREMGTGFEGAAAIRGVFADWFSAYESYGDVDEARAAAERLAEERG